MFNKVRFSFIGQLRLHLLMSPVAMDRVGSREPPASQSPDPATTPAKEQGRHGDRCHQADSGEHPLDKSMSALSPAETNSTATDTEEWSGSMRRRFHSVGSMHSASQGHMPEVDASEAIDASFVRSCLPVCAHYLTGPVRWTRLRC